MELQEQDFLVPHAPKPSRALEGDFFTLRTGHGLELMGRVAETVPNGLGVFGGTKVIYLYAPKEIADPESTAVPVTRIWLGPMMVNDEGWSDRYFLRICSRPFMPGERLRRHVLWTGSIDSLTTVNTQAFVGPLPERLGYWSLCLLGGIADRIKEKLGGLPDFSTPPTVHPGVGTPREFADRVKQVLANKWAHALADLSERTPEDRREILHLLSDLTDTQRARLVIEGAG
ncbi:MAG: hypothetical protein KIT68_12625 [Phycisphaeraceae bacterium]|nr:hypothetical protein [Phycisphaeraceae bacterium]